MCVVEEIDDYKREETQRHQEEKDREREREVGRWSLCDIRVVVLSACERAVWYK